MIQFDKIQSAGKEQMEAFAKSMGALSTGAQTASVEIADYAKRSFEKGTQAAEKMMGVRSLDAALEVQTEYARSAYEGFVAQATRMGELTASTAKAAYAPVEGLMGKSVQTA